MELKKLLINYLLTTKTDEEIISFFKHIRKLQVEGLQLKTAIITATASKQQKQQVELKANIHKDNIPYRLAIKHRALLLELNKNLGYGKIAKVLATRKIYNKKTRKAYSRSTIKRALQIIKERK